jgi:hypothetical protein
MTFQGIGRGVQRTPQGIVVKVEIQDAETTKLVRFQTYTGKSLEDVQAQLQVDLDRLAKGAEDVALSKAIIGVMLAASTSADFAPPVVDVGPVVVADPPGGQA